jgi:hypothetical protein
VCHAVSVFTTCTRDVVASSSVRKFKKAVFLVPEDDTVFERIVFL